MTENEALALIIMGMGTIGLFSLGMVLVFEEFEKVKRAIAILTTALTATPPTEKGPK